MRNVITLKQTSCSSKVISKIIFPVLLRIATSGRVIAIIPEESEHNV